jgi:hypothetical protein
MRQLSFLLGAGFSAPDNYPTRKGLNERLRKITHEEIMIHTDGTSIFLNGLEDPNAKWTNTYEKLFVQEFLEFYSENVIGDLESFDYETFFDYYQGIHLRHKECLKFNAFADSFRAKYNRYTDNINLLNNFHNTFNQLLAGQLMRWPEHVHLAKNYTKYPEFLTFIEEIEGSFDKIHFHTLNHDLLIEELANSDAMHGELSDGFEELGSPYYSYNNERNTIRLKYFSNNFSRKFCLYKLHGSIDHYVYNFKNLEYTAIKVPYGVSTNDLKKEYLNDAGHLEYDLCFWNYYPDFLSGTTEKINSYEGKHFYKPLFEHFVENLKNSDCLISIGYGLGDLKINEYLKMHFLKDKEKKMLIITPNKPDSDLFDYKNVIYYGLGKGVQNIDIRNINKLINI